MDNVYCLIFTIFGAIPHPAVSIVLPINETYVCEDEIETNEPSGILFLKRFYHLSPQGRNIGR